MKIQSILKWLTMILTLLVMLCVWPIHPFREITSVRSGDEGHEITAPIVVGESLTQYFKATDNNITSLEYVLTCDENLPMSGMLLFQILDEKENVLFEQTLDYRQVPDYSYSGVAVNLPVKKGRMYAYRITNLDVTENMPCGVYTKLASMACLSKGQLMLGEETLQGEWLTRITSNSPLSMENTLAIWGCLGMVGFAVCELIDRIKLGEKKHEVG